MKTREEQRVAGGAPNACSTTLPPLGGGGWGGAPGGISKGGAEHEGSGEEVEGEET